VLGNAGFYREGFSLAFRIGLIQVTKVEAMKDPNEMRKTFEISAHNLRNAVTFGHKFSEETDPHSFDFTAPIEELGGRSFNDALCEASFLLAKCLEELDNVAIAVELYSGCSKDIKCNELIRKISDYKLVEILNANPNDPLLQEKWAESLVTQSRFSEAADHFKAAASLYLEIVFAEEAEGVLSVDQRVSILDHAIGCFNESNRLKPSREIEQILLSIKGRSQELLLRINNQQS